MRTQSADRAMAMRAEDEDYDLYVERYRERADKDLGGEPNWELFDALWLKRHDTNVDMANLLSEVMGVDESEALAWIEDY